MTEALIGLLITAIILLIIFAIVYVVLKAVVSHIPGVGPFASVVMIIFWGIAAIVVVLKILVPLLGMI